MDSDTNTEEGEWVEGFVVYWKSTICIQSVYDLPPSMENPCGDTEIEYHTVIPETIGQYIGIKDKNNVKIFEGDIVSKGGTNYTIQWRDSLCGFHGYGDDGDKYGVFTLNLSTNSLYNQKELKKYSVIGNIHDNEISRNK